MPELCVIMGDGIGREVIPAAVTVLKAVISDLDIIEAEAGWDCFQEHGVSVPDSTLERIRACGAALFGAVSSPAYHVEGYRSAVLTIRQELGLYANIRPVRSWPTVSPVQGVDLIVVRENSEGLYIGRERLEGDSVVAERVISKKGSLRIANKCVELAALSHRKKITIVHKANVLPLSDGLFRDTVKNVAAGKFLVDELLVDVAALKMVADPHIFDVLITTNLYGDILSDAAAHWGGGLGLAPSLNWGDGVAAAEPVHGSAPDIAGKGVANPIAAVLSGALLARYFWQDGPAADRIETAVYKTLLHAGQSLNGTIEITNKILANLENI